MSPSDQPAPLGEVETPRPWRGRDGTLRLAGWCLLDGSAAVPPVRLRVGERCFAADRGPRPDLAASLPAQPAAAAAGFSVAATLPTGVHVLEFEARTPDGSWRPFRSGVAAVERPDFRAALDQPLAHGVLRDRVKVGGWAAADRRIATLEVRYGHRSLPCRLGLPRPDTPEGGFESADFLVAGHGPARLRATLSDGAVRVARTGVAFAIAEDENHPRALALAEAERVPLPRGERRAPAAAPAAPRARNVLFLLHGSFAANSALHVAALANELAATGHDCAVAVPHDVATIAHLDAPRFRALTFEQAAEGGGFPDGRGPDIVHAWTTREAVRRLAEEVRARHGGAIVVHLEDNEQEVLAQALGRPFAELDALPDTELDRIVPPDLSHPRRSREFLARATGVTLITEKLREFVPSATRTLTLWPAADERHFHPRPVPTAFRAAVQLPPDTTVLFYHGNVHAANAAEVRELYVAVARLNASGLPATLIRSGLDAVDLLGADDGRLRAHVLELGQVLHHRHLPPLMALADVFVQPGAPDAFNDYRFPSKLPEFFALGRPVVLPRTNLGAQVRHGVDAYVLERADADGIVRAVRDLHADPALARRLADGAVAFAARNFSWRRSAEALAMFYAALAPS
jgi:glycosyltransferase involved in cell wall biosynthesis